MSNGDRHTQQHNNDKEPFKTDRHGDIQVKETHFNTITNIESSKRKTMKYYVFFTQSDKHIASQAII